MKIFTFPYENPSRLTLLKQAEAYPVREGDVFTLPFALFRWARHQAVGPTRLSDDIAHYRKAIYHQLCTIQEQSCAVLSAEMGRQALPTTLSRRPGIMATFHLGSYRLIGKWLAMQGIPFVLLVTKQVKNEQETLYRDVLRPYDPQRARFVLLDAESPRVLLELRKWVANGFFVLIYADGNSGSGRQDKHRSDVQFGKLRLSVRMGIPTIGRLLHLPIYPIYSLRSAGAVQLILHDPLDGGTTPGQVMQRLYAGLYHHATACPEQWEGWFYLQDCLLQTTATPVFQRTPPEDRMPVRLRGQKSMLDIATGLFCEAPTCLDLEL